LLGLDVEVLACRTTDAIDMRGCFRTIDCSTAGSRSRNRPTKSRRAKIWVALIGCAHTRPGRSFRITGENARCAKAMRRSARPRFPAQDGFCIVVDKRKPKQRLRGRVSGPAGPSAPDPAKINWRGSLAFCGPTFCSLLIVGPRLQLCSRAHRQVGRDQSPGRDLAKRATASNSAALGHSSFTEQVPHCRMTWDGQAPLACRWTNPDTAQTLTRSDTL